MMRYGDVLKIKRTSKATGPNFRGRSVTYAGFDGTKWGRISKDDFYGLLAQGVEREG
jgi:hypothetical protein